MIATGRRRRRIHSPHFKAEAVGACQQPGVSIAAVSLARGLNAAMLRRWVKQAERSGRPIAISGTAPGVAIESGESFVPVALPLSAVEGSIRIEVRRRGGTVSVEWPASAAHECAQLLRAHEVIRIDAAWFPVEPLDMRAGVDKALARVVSVFGEAGAYHAYLFINKRANRCTIMAPCITTGRT